MSIARRARLLSLTLALAAFAGVTFGDEPPPAPEASAAEQAEAPAEPIAAPAEPIAPPAAPGAAPVMPTTVVRPRGVQGDSASATPAAAAAATAAKPGNVAKPTPAVSAPRPQSLGAYGSIELGRPPSTASRWHGFPISLSLRDAPLPEVLRSFARLAGVNLVLAPGVTGTVTVELKDVPWDQALWVILKTQGMAAEIDGRVWTVEPY